MSKVKPVMPDFDTIPVSTKTVIAQTNAKYTIQKLFDSLPVTHYEIIPKKRGRKKQNLVVDPNKDLASGSIITLKYFENIRGVNLKPKKKKSKFFRNALSVVMKVDDKLVNFKLSKNGKFQMTGIKEDRHAVNCVKCLWKHILDLDDHTLYSISGDKLSVIFRTVMTNIDFSLGFLVNRENLDSYFNRITAFNSLLETSFGYTGVNIKFPNDSILYESLDNYTMDVKKREWVKSQILYKDYLNGFSIAERNKTLNKKRFHTFLVFHSGNVIMSGTIRQFMKGPYYKFLEIIKECKDEIEEKLDV